MRTHSLLVLLVLVATKGVAQSPAATRLPKTGSENFVVPAWAFPTQLPPSPDPFPTADSLRHHHISGVPRTFTQKEALNRFAPVDWNPASHPKAPASVAHGRPPSSFACAFCHLYTGAGRPENATLAGLPAEYIVRQVHAFRDSTRLSANPAARTNSMHGVARAVTESELEEAARYFARLALRRRNRVVETANVPTFRIAGLLYAREGNGTEPIAGRLIEMPEDIERHELHDPTIPYVTYVPPGTLALGRRLVRHGPNGAATACATCHGAGLLGVGSVPPIAGRSPQYLLRQLINLRTGARADSGSEPMQPIVHALTLNDMLAAAAYVGSLPPSAAKAR